MQQLDDIGFSLGNMGVLGGRMHRACNAPCFRAEFAQQRFGANKHKGRFLKVMYLINLVSMVGLIARVSVKQVRQDYQSSDITVDFGGTVWNEAWVTLPPWLPPHLNASAQVGQKESWTLVFAYFNGVYTQDGTHEGRPVYRERRKSNHAENFDTIVPAKIKYCGGDVKAWVFTHPQISKRKTGAQVIFFSRSDLSL